MQTKVVVVNDHSNMRKFLEFVEIRTKITSLLPFLMSLSYLFYRRLPVNLERTLLFFSSMFLFDLTTTAINNYIDTKTNGQELPFPRGMAKLIIYLLFGVSTVLGLTLAYRTDLVVLLLGGLCFLCGVFYTWGPIPISRLPLGEIFSGLFYGLFIPFLMLYMNMPSGTFLTLTVDWSAVRFDLNLAPAFSLLLVTAGPICATSNIMLANNICDLEKDITVGRYTLPYFFGKNALDVFAGLYYVTYLTWAVSIALRILSPVCLLALLTIIPVHNNICRFRAEHIKEKTFILSVQNYIIIVGAQTLVIFFSGLFL
ncbi:MAG TPA: prenyltransferase [Lachnoclostridium sp.]|jgi:1,4-dihydroxy-2-naphthoate octaprenyltransferase|uniref:UbiA family prenyltransferase n=1 Tax=Lacrimispora sp. TaxID=2719234 RepID=UPI000EE0BEF0|nr:UbiA family prenyltransferase [Lacrimispora sp.]HCD45070.1 prenyltransferase [Lachnoclostridium sp.]